MALEREGRMNVGYLRRVIADLPDDASIFPDWADGPPDDSAPGVELDDFKAEKCTRSPDCGDDGHECQPFLSVKVRLFSLDDCQHCRKDMDECECQECTCCGEPCPPDHLTVESGDGYEKLPVCSEECKTELENTPDDPAWDIDTPGDGRNVDSPGDVGARDAF